MTAEPLSPVDIENRIRTIASEISAGVDACNQAYIAFLRADWHYDQAYASAYVEAEGPAHEKKYRAELGTGALRRDRDIADAAYRYADRQARAKVEELRAYQSVGASIRAQYEVAGRGEHY